MGIPIHTDHAAIKRQLLGRRFRAAEISSVDASGVYVLLLIDPSALPSVTTGGAGVLYVGMTESSLDVRNHFTHAHSGFSSVRRSLGALLRQELQLQAKPRAPGASRTNIRNFRFSDEGERRLTEWMVGHLAYGVAPVDHDIRSIERKLIADLEPPLNLTALGHWHNPYLATVRQLRSECRNQAYQIQSGAP